MSASKIFSKKIIQDNYVFCIKKTLIRIKKQEKKPRERKVTLALECQIIATLVTRNEPFFFRNSDVNFASAPHWAKIQDSGFKILDFVLFISLTTANIEIKAENRGKQRFT